MGKINNFNWESKCQVLASNRAIRHLFEGFIIPFNKTILLRGVGNRVVMNNSMFSIEILKYLISIVPPIIGV